MGVYSANRISSFGIDTDAIVANENYTNAVDAELILIESHQNDMAIFEAVLANDFAEAIATNEGTLLEAELAAITEGTVGDFFNKIKEFIQKVWAKIKGIFKAFMVKLTNVVTKDNKAFVDKYKDDVLKKDLSKMKYKFAKPTGKTIDFVKGWDDGEVTKIYALTSTDAVSKHVEDNYDDDKLLEEILGKTIGGSSVSAADYEKEAREYEFEDEEEYEGLPANLLSLIITSLSTADKSMKDLNKMQSDIDKTFSKEIKRVDTVRNSIIKSIPDKADTDEQKADKDIALAKANAHYKLITIFQAAATKSVSAFINGVKFEIKQQRAIFAKAAAYNPKAKNESAVLEEAVYEAAEYEVESLFDCYA